MAYEEVFTALADATRRSVFESLRDGPRTVSELALQAPVSRPAVSQHLKVLEGAGLVSVQAQGTRRYYAIRQDGLAELRRYLDSFWSDVLSSYAAHLQSPPTHQIRSDSPNPHSEGEANAATRHKDH